MRKIDLQLVSDKIKELFIDACENIPENVLNALKKAAEEEQSPLSKEVINKIVENAYLGREKHLPICQDTGVAVVYLTIGSEVYFEGDIYEAVKTSVDIIKSFKSETLSAENCMKAGYTDNAGLLLDDTREMNFTFAYDAHIMSLGYKTLEERKAAYEKITPEQVRLGACQIFTPDNLVLTVKGNKKKIDTARLSELISAL
jgi:predicted Zn-dependent peptidase